VCRIAGGPDLRAGRHARPALKRGRAALVTTVHRVAAMVFFTPNNERSMASAIAW
jgi:hypothetical protein